MALPVVQPRLAALGLNPKLRQAKSGAGPYLTDEGVYPTARAEGLRTPGPIGATAGLSEWWSMGYLGTATLALVAGEDCVSEYRP